MRKSIGLRAKPDPVLNNSGMFFHSIETLWSYTAGFPVGKILKNFTKGLDTAMRMGYTCTAQHSTAQHSTAQHSTAQHSTAQHSTAQHSTG